jgi:hypothetical protein
MHVSDVRCDVKQVKRRKVVVVALFVSFVIEFLVEEPSIWRVLCGLSSCVYHSISISSYFGAVGMD